MVTVFCHSEPGGHSDNEDAVVVRLLPSEETCYVCAVADGQGGRAGGAVAAQVACQVCLEVASRYPPEKLLGPKNWPAILRQADEAVLADPAAGFTTLVAFCI